MAELSVGLADSLDPAVQTVAGLSRGYQIIGRES